MWYNFSCKDSTEGLQDFFGPLIGWLKVGELDLPVGMLFEMGDFIVKFKQCHRFGRGCLKFKDDGVNKSDGMLSEPIFWTSALPYILLMEEILQQLLGSLSHYLLLGFIITSQLVQDFLPSTVREEPKNDKASLTQLLAFACPKPKPSLGGGYVVYSWNKKNTRRMVVPSWCLS